MAGFGQSQDICLKEILDMAINLPATCLELSLNCTTRILLDMLIKGSRLHLRSQHRGLIQDALQEERTKNTTDTNVHPMICTMLRRMLRLWSSAPLVSCGIIAAIVAQTHTPHKHYIQSATPGASPHIPPEIGGAILIHAWCVEEMMKTA